MTGVVLAGGRGRRLGGCDKGLVEVAGRPLIEHVIERLAPQVDETIINANRNVRKYSRYHLPIIADQQTDYGPIGGMLRALEVARYPLVLSVPCDAARLPLDLAERLRAKLDNERLDACVAHDGARVQPVCCLMRRRLKPWLTHFVAQGGRAMHAWLNTLCWTTADFSGHPKNCWSVNTRSELRQLLGLMQC